MDQYVESSLELHLYFARIMKEHSLFLEVGFIPNARNYIGESKWFKVQFEELLCRVLNLSKGIIPMDTFNMGDIVTEYTYCSEKKTCELTGANLNQDITRQELLLSEKCVKRGDYNECNLKEAVKRVNIRSLELLNGLIDLKNKILCEVLECKMYTVNYPLLIEHIIREADLYRNYVLSLLGKSDMKLKNCREMELFWDQIMLEHALFIRGLLDPAEPDLIATADDFAHKYASLMDATEDAMNQTIPNITDETTRLTKKYRNFKETATKGINNCEIRSLILPLLADHVLREANHFLKLLK
ncbi:conserved protein [Lachnospiraceae bacterium KM106-2]|nr:conserved protein [Lachnospiraceae bacterium KM106-2]